MPRITLRQVIILISSTVAIFYIFYRAIWTLNLTSPYAVFASLFLYIGELYGVLTMVLYFLQVWDTTEPPEKPPLPGRTVDVFVPTYNEDPDLLRVTLRACVAMDYPHKTYLCDDGGTEARLRDPQKGPPSAARAAALKAICAEVGAIYLTRPENSHAKAGNLNHAFTKTDGEFILIFDADHVPDPNFISRLIGYFEDEKLGFVQTPHAFYNFDSFQARLDHGRGQYWEEGQLFYHVIQPGRNRWNAPIFAGSAALFRRQALAEVGYIATETITEDMHTGLRMHSKGWKSLGLGCRMISGQAAQDVTTFHSQRLRWGEGNLSVLAHDNPLTLRGLGWGQRLCYFATMINWCGGLFKLPIYITPLLMLLTGIPPVKEFTWTPAAIMVAYMTVSILGTKYVSNGYGSVWYSELFTMASFWTQVRGTMRALFLRKLQQFVVTAKRGRQSKSIWPFIRPQVYLIGASIFALLWAWGRLWGGISDDFFKPILATFWTLFHVLLAYLVVRRALWPDERRYSTRHLVHLPVAYEQAGGPRRLGVSADLNELGIGFVAYEKLEVGSTLQLSIHAPGETVSVEGVIKNARKVVPADGSADSTTGYRYGVAFQNLDAARTDGLHHIGLHYAVPRLYAYYGGSHLSVPQTLWGRFASRFLHRRYAERREYHLPLFLQLGDGEAVPTVTEDLSRTAAAVLLHQDLPRGTEVSFRLETPLGELQGRGRVKRTTPRVFAGRKYWLCVLEFTHFEGQGWSTMQVLVGGGPGGRLRPVLKPIKAPMPVPVNRPLAAAVALFALLGAAEFAACRWIYRDDFFLKSVASRLGDLDAEEMARVERIFRETMGQKFPSTDRLVLLSRAFRNLDRPNEMAEVTKLLAPRDRDNFDLQLGLAYAYDQQEDYDKAVAVCERLLAALDRGTIPARRREEILLAAARAHVHLGDIDRADEYFRRVLEAYPDKMAYRNELAGVLLSGRRLVEADQLYQGVEPDYEGRVLLVMIHAASKQYERATQEARVLLQERPGDATVEELLADVLSMQDNHLQAQAIYQRLASGHAADVRIGLQLAHSAMWNKNYQEALDRFQAILDRNLKDPAFLRKNPQVLKAFLNAAASAPRIGDAARATLLALYDRMLMDAGNDVVYLTRLSWVLSRLDESDKCAAVLERAASLDPADPALRRQIAAGFVGAGRPEAALKLLEGHESDLEARLLVADSYVVARNFPAAIQSCRDLLQAYPDSVEARFRLANVLSWSKAYKESLELFADLARKDPGNPLYPVRLAEVTLWSGKSREAVDQLEKLLAKDFDQPLLWWDFVDAASAAPSLTDSQVRVAAAICDKTLEGEHRSERVVQAFRKEDKPLAEATYLARLAWVFLHHVKDPKKANALLDKALAASPEGPAGRKELAGVLAAAGRFTEALRMYQGLALDLADRLNLARIQAGAGNFNAAAEQCRLILRKQPLDKDAQVVLADVLSWGGQLPESIELFDKLVKAFPDDEYLRRRQAEVVLWGDDRVRALALFQALLESNPDQPALVPGYLEAAGEVDRLTPAQGALARRLVEQPIADQVRNVELLARAAWVLSRHLNDRGRAEDLLRRAAALKSQDPVVLSRLGWTLYRVGNKSECDRVLREALALGSKSPAARRELAGVLAATQHFKEAQGLYEELAKAAPRDAAVQADLAEVTLWAGAPAAALERLRPLLEADVRQARLCRSFVDAAAGVPALTEPQLHLLQRLAEGPLPVEGPTDQALYLSRLSWSLWREGERLRQPALRTRAETLLDKALALKPADAKARQELAGVLVAAGRPRDALPWLEEAARNHPGDTAAQAYLAQVTVWAGDCRRALERLQPLLEARFDQPALWVSFVDAAGAAPRGAMNARQVELALRLAAQPPPKEAPDPVRYQLRLSGALFREGRKDVAADLLAKATAQPPRDNETRREWAGVLTAAGRHADALALIEELARANPDDARFQGQLAQATLWSGDAPRALERLQKLLGANFDQPELWVSFVDAASGLDKGRLTREQLQLAVRLADRPAPETAPDKVLYLSRLAWVLHREEYRDRASALLDQAVASSPSDPKVRRELAGVLVAAGKNEAGLRLYEGLTLDLEDRYQLMVLHAAAKQFGQAEAQCRFILKERPADARARQWLADLALWTNQYQKALDLYQEILAANFEQPRLWPHFVEAASFADHPTEEQVRLALRISERSAADARDPLLLAWMALVQYRHVESRVFHARLAAGVVAMMAPVGLVPAPLLCPAPSLADLSRETTALALMRRAADLRPREPTVLARLSWAAYQMGQQLLSGQLLDEAIALQPTESAVRREIGDVLVATGRLREGLRWFEDLSAVFPVNRDFQVRLAEVTVWAGEYAQGLERVEKVLGTELDPQSLWHTFVDGASATTEMTPSQIQLAVRLSERPVPVRGVDEQVLYLSRLSWALFREGERARTGAWNGRVNALLDKALALKPRDSKVRSELASMLTAARRFGEAGTLYEGLLRDSPGDPDLLVRLAEVTLWGGNVTGGLARFEQLLRDNVQRPGVWKGFAAAAAAAPTLTGAQTELALRLADQVPHAGSDERVPLLARLARALSREAKRTDDGKLRARADAVAGEALKLDPKKPEDCRELATALAAMGQTKQALDLLQKAGDVPSRVLRICILADSKAMDQAESEARLLAREKPDDPDAQLLLADVLSWNKKLDEAAALFSKLHEAHRDDPRVLRRLAEVALWAGQYDRSLGRYLQLLEADWNQPDLWQGYIDAASAARNVSGEAHKKMVLRIYEKGLATMPKDPTHLARFAWVLRRVGEPRKGVHLLRQALELEPGSREVRMRLAEALQDLGDFTEAERHYAILLRTAPARP